MASEVDTEGTGVFGTVARAQIVSEAVFSSGVAPSLAHNFTCANETPPGSQARRRAFRLGREPQCSVFRA